MALITTQGFNLGVDISPLTRQIGDALNRRNKIEREDQLSAQKQQALSVQKAFKTAGAQALRVFGIKDFSTQRKQVAILAQEAIKRGEDPQQFVDALNIQNQDEFNLNLRRIATAAGNADKLLERGLKEQAQDQFEPVKDAEGNIVAQRNSLTGKVIADPRAKADSAGLSEVKSSKILDDGTFVMLMKNGDTRVTTSAGEELEGEARTKAILGAQEFGVDIQQRRAKGRSIGKGTAKIAIDSFDKVGLIRDNVLDLKSGIELIEKEGARTGFVSDFLPSMRAGTRKFDNLRRKLGLNVVASVTFGALSEGELKLAMDVALPKGLSEKETINWIKVRIAAQEKLANNLEDAALFLSEPGNNVADLIRRNRAMKKASEKKQEIEASPVINQPTGEIKFIGFE